MELSSGGVVDSLEEVLDELLSGEDSPEEVLSALLELYKNGELVWRQRETFGSIEIMSPAKS